MRPTRIALERAIVLVAASCLVAACSPASDGGLRPTPAGTGTGTTPAATASPTGTGEPTAAAGPRIVRLTPPAGGSFLLRGRYPRVESRCRDPEQPSFTARIPGAVRIDLAEDGTMTLLATLSFERYLEGIAEVPASWPRAVLEAQAIAARSYALASTGWSGQPGDTLDEPICATTSCQVYRGIPVPRQPSHHRWVAAVRRTAGQVLLHEGRPATTFYFSTSNGRTYGNEEVFGGDPLPYLRPVVEQDDGASSTSRWGVRLPFRDLTRFLRAAGLWPHGPAIAIARPRPGDVVFEAGDRRRAVALTDLRAAVNDWAPCLEPRRYPGTLPLTIPSRWLEVSAGPHALTVTGRGWGHGVGMVQWGAYGKARRGLSAPDILAAYYGGLRPRSFPEPGVIEVEVVSGLISLRLAPSGQGARIGHRRIDGRVIVAAGDGLEVRTAATV